MISNKIFVTKPVLPPFSVFSSYLERIWSSNWLTNNGPLVQELETKLKDYLGVKHLFFVSNGTIALQIAIKALGITGEIITTPFSYVASTSSILWEGCTPVFCDVDKTDLTIDSNLIKRYITPKTQAILGVHVYGFPCHVEEIEQIAAENNLKVIYDGAHTFGVQYKQTSVLNFGNISTLSFHATKLFHTGEGGAIVTNDDELARKISLMRSFGHEGDEYYMLGVNGKNSEFHAAMGLSLFPMIEEILVTRVKLTNLYNSQLEPLSRSKDIQTPRLEPNIKYNHAYYPVIFSTESDLLKVKGYLESNEIYPRRYFYPSLNTLNYVPQIACPVSESISRRVLCLPLYHTLSEESVKLISQLMSEALKS